MSEARTLHFSSLRLDPIEVEERPGFGPDRLRARVGPYEVRMDEARRVWVLDLRIEDEADRRARADTYDLREVFELGTALIVDQPGTACPAEDLTERQRAAALWAGAYLLVEGSRYMRLDGE
jgi:hypothetical protein